MSITIDEKIIKGINIDKKEVIKIQDAKTLNILWEKVEPNYLYIENVDESDCELSFTTYSSTTLPPSDKYTNRVEFSTDKETWTTWNFDTANTLTIPIGGKVYLRNDSGAFSYYGTDGYYYITSINTTMKCNVGGNINTLLNYNEEILDISDKRSCFRWLFKGAKIVDASKLVMPATTLSQYCYAEFFSGNSSLIAPPELPAVNLADNCYYNFFYGCSSLNASPVLPATTLAEGCYMGLFARCTSLNEVTVYADDISAKSCTRDWLSGVGDSIANFIGLDTGGYVKTTGLAVLHPNEVVVNDDTTKRLQNFLGKYDSDTINGVSRDITQPQAVLNNIYPTVMEAVPVAPVPAETVASVNNNSSFVTNTQNFVQTSPAPQIVEKTGETKNDYSVTFSAGSIIIQLANTSDSELEKSAEKIMKIIARKQQLRAMAVRA